MVHRSRRPPEALKLCATEPPRAPHAAALGLDAPGRLYPATAIAPAAAPELSEDARAEILIVGGGYTTLSTAPRPRGRRDGSEMRQIARTIATW